MPCFSPETYTGVRFLSNAPPFSPPTALQEPVPQLCSWGPRAAGTFLSRGADSSRPSWCAFVPLLSSIPCGRSHMPLGPCSERRAPVSVCRQPGPLASLFPSHPRGVSPLPPNLLPAFALGLPPQVSSQDLLPCLPAPSGNASVPLSVHPSGLSALWCTGLPQDPPRLLCCPLPPCWPLSSLVWPVLSARINLSTRVGVPLSLQCEHPPEGTLLLRGRVLPHGTPVTR